VVSLGSQYSVLSTQYLLLSPRLVRRIGWLIGLALLVGVYMRYLESLPSSDWTFYYEVLGYSQRGVYPFVHYWAEYPPLFPLLLVGVQQLTGSALWTDRNSFSQVYIAFMTLVYVGNLVLVWDLVRIGHGVRAARWAVVLYGGCPLIAWFTVGWFDALALLLLLLGVRTLLARGARRAGVLIGLGIMMKVFPGVLLLAAPGAIGWRGVRRLSVTLIAALGVVLVPLAAIRPDLLWATAVSILTRPAWETFPALLAGDYLYGLVTPIAERFTADTARSTSTPSSTLALALQLTTALIAVGAAWFRTRRGKLGAADVYALVALGVCALLLGSKGFSPQYLLWLMPLVLLVWPNRAGALYMLAFSVYCYCYYQYWFHDIVGYFQLNSVPFDQLVQSAWLSATTRTVLLLVLMAHLLLRTCRDAENDGSLPPPRTHAS
jgi:hypothetical protein